MDIEETTVAGFPAVHAAPGAGATATGTVLFLHGAFADEAGFAGWVDRFADAGYDAWAPARRGRRGVGPERAAGLGFDDYVADTLAVIDDLSPARPPVLVGHSLGGLIAQRVAEQGRAAAIALLAPAPPAMLTAQAVALPRFAPQLPRIMCGRPFIVGNDACSVLALNRVPEPERPAIHAHLTHESGAVYRAMMLGRVRVDAAKVRVPVLVASGPEDRIISPRLARRTARHYGAEAHSYPGRGHWLIQEPGWQEVADDVISWLTACLPTDCLSLPAD
jgi:pimeloyl-ACP methyl ester carboxylesterase